jgi:hypothetical protein
MLDRASASSFACILESGGPVRTGVQAERIEFIGRAWTPSAAGRMGNSGRRRETRFLRTLRGGHPTDRRRWTTAQRAVWTDGVVVLPPHFNDQLGFPQRVENLPFRHSSRSFPLKDSQCPFSPGLPGSMNGVSFRQGCVKGYIGAGIRITGAWRDGHCA